MQGDTERGVDSFVKADHLILYKLINYTGKPYQKQEAIARNSDDCLFFFAFQGTQALAMASFTCFLVCSRSAISIWLGLKIRLKRMVQTAATTTAM